VDFEATVELLIRAGAATTLTWGDFRGMAPLHLAAAGGAYGVVQLLVGVGAPARLKNPLTEETARHLAVKADYGALAALLEEFEATEDGTEAVALLTAESRDGRRWREEVAALAARGARSPSKAAAAGEGAGAAGEAAGEGGIPGGGGAIYIHPWLQCYDPNSGYPYWFNTETQESLWEPPPAVAEQLERLGYNGAYIEGSEGAEGCGAFGAVAGGAEGFGAFGGGGGGRWCGRLDGRAAGRGGRAPPGRACACRHGRLCRAAGRGRAPTFSPLCARPAAPAFPRACRCAEHQGGGAAGCTGSSPRATTPRCTA
jgi:hypothetical protein